MKIKISKNKLKTIPIIILLILNFSNPIFARYYERLEQFLGKASIAEFIIKVEPLQDTIITEINKESLVKEYNFCVKNYLIDGNMKRINEVDCLYDIEIKNSSKNFPIKYELYDLKTGEEILKGSDNILRIRNSKRY
ncbi:MAG: hypothetical protein IKL55_05515 [Clostridia bacterium]|nr:hypothetical protein [Clostridia bacterium]